MKQDNDSIEAAAMTDFALARKNMIDCQIATMGVIDPVLLDILGSVPREQFVPEQKRSLAYIDEDLPLDGGSFLMEPLTFARMVQAAAPRDGEIALCLGDVTGYAAAVLSRMVGKVVVPETVHGGMDNARVAWNGAGCRNVMVAPGDSASGCPAYGPFDLIIINGSVPVVPTTLTDQLAERGRLLTILRKVGAQDGRAVLVTRIAGVAHSSKILFDAATPFIPELTPKKAFAF